MDVLFLVGPTAVGKTAVAVELALRVGGEIVSADSMQVYRGLDLITAKPTRAQRDRVPHHLIDILDPEERFDASQYSRLARDAIAGICRRGRMPVVVGGSGMYMRALADGLFNGPGRDEAIRARLEKEADEKGLRILYERLRKADPAASAAIHPNDRRRIIRALEILHASGSQPSSLRMQWHGGGAEADGAWFSENLGCACVFAGLRRGKEDLKKRIRARVDCMLRDGAIEEVRALLKKGIKKGGTVWQMLGLKEIRGCIEGAYGLREARDMLERATRAYAKRQMTWFRKDRRIAWFDIEADEPPAMTAKKILAGSNLYKYS